MVEDFKLKPHTEFNIFHFTFFILDHNGINKAQMERHYTKLQAQFKLQKTNTAVLRQLLKLELPSRCLFVEGIKGDTSSKVAKFLETYPCFKSVDEVC